MPVNDSTRYGILAIGYIATHPKDGPIAADTISKEYDIPIIYLLKIMQGLARVGILSSKPGPHGGFVLGRPPEQLSVLSIIEAIEGFAPKRVELLESPIKERFFSKVVETCERALAEHNKFLAEVTLAEVIGSKSKLKK
jgi:Rrf2 family iron-sulfur cluster assembly transcriptional regulator